MGEADRDQMALRRRAEQILQQNPGNDNASWNDTRELVHELQVYQTELEMQNEELRRSQEELQLSRKRYVDLYDFAPVGYITLDEQGRIVEANLTGAMLLGLAREHLLKKLLTQFVVPDDQDIYYLYYRHLTTTKQRQMCELQLRRSDGTLFHARLEGSIEQEADRQHARMVIVDVSDRVQAEEALRKANEELERRVQERTTALADTNTELQAEIEERKRTEAALRQSENRFRLVLKDSFITVFTQNRDLRYTWIYNSAGGYAPDEVVGRSDFDLFDPEDAQRLFDIKRRVLQSGVGTSETVRVTLDKGEAWYDLKVEPLTDAQDIVIGVMCVATDVTNYRRALDVQQFLIEVSDLFSSPLDTVSRLEKFVRLLVQKLADLCIVHILAESESTNNMLVVHHDPDSEARIRVNIQGYAPSIDRQPLVECVLRAGQTVYHREIPDEIEAGEDQDGYLMQLRSWGATSYIGVPLEARGTVLGVLSMVRNYGSASYMPEDVLLVQELARRAAMALDNAYLYEAEQQARAEAETAVQMRDQVFRLISHDLRSPLTAIQGYAHLLNRRLRGVDIPDAERITRGLTHIEKATNRMSAQIQELLDVASLQAGKSIRLNRGTFDILVMTQRVIEAHQETLSVLSLQFETILTDMQATGDEARLERVLDNLITNAIKYSPDGGAVVVSLAQEMRGEQRWAVVVVRDQGLGIPENELPHIFEPFRRASNVSGTISGTGLGLASVRQIIEQHGGTISVSSQEGSGTTFVIQLPLDEP
jgi:PAS domain S-box-containing protein